LETPEEDAESTETLSKWKRLSDAALKMNNFELAEAASIASDDFSGLLLLYSATGNAEGMEKLAKMAESGGKTNVAFMSYFLTGNVEACADLLVATKRLPEAAFFVRSYLPSRINEIVSLWKDDLAKVSESAADSLANPAENPVLFPDMDIGLQVENMFLAQREATAKQGGIPANDYLTAKDDLDLDLIGLIKQKTGMAPPPPPPVEEMKTMQIDPDVAAAKMADEEAAAAIAEAEAEAEAAAAEKARIEAEAEAEAKAAAEEDDGFGEDW